MFVIMKLKGEWTEFAHIYGWASNIIKKKNWLALGYGAALHLLNSRWHPNVGMYIDIFNIIPD